MALRLMMNEESKEISVEQLDSAIQSVITKHGKRPDIIVITDKQLKQLKKSTLHSFMDAITKQVVIIGLTLKPYNWRGLELDVRETP